MPEGDVVLRTAQRLHQALSGLPLTTADLRFPEASQANVTGYIVDETVSYGKHILTRLTHPHREARVTIHSHLRMEGLWYIFPTGKAPAGDSRSRVTHRTRAILATRTWTALGQRLGMLDVVRTDEESTLIGHLGPDILGPSWDLDQAIANISQAPQCHIGAALLDQRNVAGIGTYFMSESLFVRGISPWTPVENVRDLPALLTLNQVMLAENSKRAVQATTGSTRPGETSYVHARSGRTCRRCRTTVRVAMIGPKTQERTAFYCPQCQPGPRPTDSGQIQTPLGSSTRSPRRKPKHW